MRRLRTLWLASPNTRTEVTFSRPFTAAVACKAVLVVLESGHKSRWVRWDNDTKHSPEEISGLFDLARICLAESSLIRGYSKIMTLDDLYPLDQSITAERLHAQLAKAPGSSGQKYDLAKTLARVFTIPLLLPIAPRIGGWALSNFVNLSDQHYSRVSERTSRQFLPECWLWIDRATHFVYLLVSQLPSILLVLPRARYVY